MNLIWSRRKAHHVSHVLLWCGAVLLSSVGGAQRGSATLSEAEVERVRDAAAMPADRVVVFQKIIETRIDRIQRVLADARAQGRADDIHQNMDEVSSIVNELEDNLDEYSAAHKDLRKPLPGLVTATQRWASILKQPPDQERYKLARSLALEALNDLQDQASRLITEQQKYFKEHPPSREPEPKQYEVPR